MVSEGNSEIISAARSSGRKVPPLGKQWLIDAMMLHSAKISQMEKALEE